MYTEWETAIAFNRKCCSSWNVLFLRWQMPRFQPTSHTHSRSLSVNVCACVCWAVQCCYCCRRCRCRRHCCCCFPYQNRSFKCVFTCIVGRLLCLRLFDVLQTGEVNALAQSKSTVEKLKNQFAVEKENRTEEIQRTKTKQYMQHVMSHDTQQCWFEFVLNSHFEVSCLHSEDYNQFSKINARSCSGCELNSQL